MNLRLCPNTNLDTVGVRHGDPVFPFVDGNVGVVAGGVSIGFLTSVPLMLFLFYTTLVVVVLAATDFEITIGEGYILLAMYIGFLGWMTSEALGFTTLLTEQTLRTIVG